MSIWTKVNASVRLGTHVGLDQTYELSTAVHDFNNEVPTGSEGPLTVSYVHTYLSDNQSFTTFSISGSLRDYYRDNVDEELIPWLNEIIKGKNITSGIAEIEVCCQDCVEYILQIQCVDKDFEWVTIQVDEA